MVVIWEQRGCGKSYPSLNPKTDLTVDQYASDIIELTDMLRERFDEEKIYLVGHSWGTIIGVPRGPAASRPVPRLRRHGPDGGRAGNRPDHLRDGDGAFPPDGRHGFCGRRSKRKARRRTLARARLNRTPRSSDASTPFTKCPISKIQNTGGWRHSDADAQTARIWLARSGVLPAWLDEHLQCGLPAVAGHGLAARGHPF